MGHPAHYHNVKFVAKTLSEKGHRIIYVARKKDVLFELLEGVEFKTIYLKARHSSSRLGLYWAVLKREIRLFGICIRYRPKILIGTDIVITHIAKILRKKSLVLNEDDSKEVPFLAKFGFKYSTHTLSPNCCDISPYNHKKIGYNGYHELAYLAPRFFQQSKSRLKEMNLEQPYFILRFAKLNAHHDDGKKGISDELALEIIKRLSPFGRVYLTSERKFGTSLEPYRTSVSPSFIHDALSAASLYIGDSQTMAAEAAVLGTPSIRFNDFVGKLSYLEELEHKYSLTCGFSTDQSDQLLLKIDELMKSSNLKETWKKRQQKMLESCDDVHDEWINIIEKLS
ncbi:MAG: putative glycosyltransferase [Parvicellaceae bacterium]|jgi:predicted glycosyltransferase